MLSAMQIRDATRDDAAKIAAIYSPHVSDSAVSFELVPPSAQAMASRIERATWRYPWIVAVIDEEIAGYAYASPFRTRPAYRFAAESTVYVDPAFQKGGVGKRLMQSLLNRLYSGGHHRVFACITLPNEGSVALHESLGFDAAGVFSEVGQKFQSWHDVGFWGLTLSDESVPLPDHTANEWRMRFSSANSEPARKLMELLSAELAQRYGSHHDGSGDFTASEADGKGSAFLMGWLQDAPVACGAVRRLEADVAELKRMFVTPECRGKGLSKRMLNRLELEAGRLGYRTLRLETGVLQPEAISLYETTGFQRIPCYGKYAAYARSVCYEKALGDDADGSS
ncbi:MAG: GNAT family N-acetyltransferase [Planctomycetota bacterium]